ncbi:hypothetical protein [Christiangramia sp. LLG6405-1]|uniref:hypothetical protein n=1 Tax=Christiangramia sp. LLG6405-1 TaxID=3160832 RepID=UPI003868CE16
MKYCYFLSLCCALIFSGCTNDSNENGTIYLGGQINNPETDFVVISKENKIIDTLFLDAKNQFGKNYPELEAGIYTFNHPPESQIMYMEPGDSVLIYLNTLSFDESLNFSGAGSEKSNFLLDMFLKNEQNNDLILTYYKIAPSEFARITDSIRQQRIDKLNTLSEEREFSEDFLEIAHASIDYEYFDLRERYTFLINKYRKDFRDQIPEDFNNYRNEIDFNNRELQDYYVYTNFIDDYLRSKAIEYCTRTHNEHKDCYNINSYKNIERRIVLIDSLSNIESLKNEFLDRLATLAIVNSERASRIDSLLQLLQDIDYTHIEDARNLAEIQKVYLNGQSLADLWAMNTAGKELKYGEIINRPTVTYAWSLYAPAHHRWQHNIISSLREKYPQVDFVGVNVDVNEREEWLRTLETFGYNKSFEYQIARRQIPKDSYRRYLNKLFFVNKDAIIVKGDIQFGNSDFEEELEKFIAQ